VALDGHDAGAIRHLAAMGKHPWVYNNGLDRYGLGIELFRQLGLGVEGRLEWIGIFTQGFAFDDLDGREPSRGAWVVHDRLGILSTPRWLSAREGLLDLRVRLALGAAVPEGDPVLAVWSADGYRADRERWTDAELDGARGAMIDRLERR
jgi:hypothetical protein